MNIRISSIFLYSATFFAVFLLPNFKPSFGFEYSIFPFLLISLVLTLGYSRTHPISTVEAAIFCLLMVSLFPSLILGNIKTYIKDLIFLLTFIFGIHFFNFVHWNKINMHKYLIAIVMINLFVALLQLLGISEILDFFLIRQSGGGTNRSVVSALYGEPSHLAVACSCMLFLFALSSNLVPLKKNYLALIALCISSFSLFILPFILLYWLLSKKKVLIAFSLLVVSFTLIVIQPNAVRVVALVSQVFDSGYLSALADSSISSRLDYIGRDVLFAYENFFLPQWLGSYPIIVQNSDFIFGSNFGLFGERKELSGSLFGHFLAELGLIFLLFIVYAFYKSFKQGGLFVFIAILLLTVIMFQMISLIFYPVAFTLGYFIGFEKQILQKKN